MSVINKMLRDLDHRANPGAGRSDPSGLRLGTASVSAGSPPPVGPKAHRSARLWLGLGVLVLAAAAFGGWMLWSANKVTRQVPAIFTAAPIAVQPVPVASAEAVPDPSTASAAVALRMESSLSARKALDAVLSKAATAAPRAPAPPPPASVRSTAPTPSAAAAAPAASAPLVAASVATTAVLPKERGAASAPPPAPAVPTAPGNSTPVLLRQQQAGGDALAQVQSLWSSGSHDAAIDLMQQSIAAAERGAKAGPSATAGNGAGGNAVLVPMVREMARMQLAEGRFGAVWDMLTRLEPQLGNQADLWAIRANAAQRLGRHQDSVRAYTMALQSRPNEQRWLLGTAVSLAALGQTSDAADMADKARAVGPVSKDILAYLRQAGVPIRE